MGLKRHQESHKMRFVLIASLLILSSYCVEGSDLSDLVKDVIQLAVMYIELVIKDAGTIDILQAKSIPLDINNTAILMGIIGFEKIQITGLGSLDVQKDNVNFAIGDSSFSFCANLSIPDTTRLQIVEYDADILLFNSIPVYGRGQVNLGLKDIDFALCVDIDTANKQLTNLLLKPNFEGLEFVMTGFWNNPDLSGVITTVVQALEGIVMAIWTNEMDCIACMLSISLKEMINDFLNTDSLAVDLTPSTCKDACTLHKDSLGLTTIFNTATSDLLSGLANDNMSQLILEMEDYLNQYLK